MDKNGKWLYSTGTLRRSKGWGKSPFLAVICLVEFMGPCRFWKFHKGQALGKRIAAPWIQLAAVAIHQTVNTMDSIRGCLVGSPLAEELDIGKTIIQFRDGRPGKIEPVTSNSSTLEGGRPTFAVLDESHHMTETNGGWKLAEVIDRNIRKNPGGFARYLETTNAYNPNQDSVAQKSHEAVLNGGRKMLYDCVEAEDVEDDWDIKDEANEPRLRELIREAYGDATWVDEDSIVEAIYDPRTSVAIAFRFYLNKVQESADAWINRRMWEELRKDEDPIMPGDQIAIGFDGSLRSDSTAIVGCRLRDGKIFLIHVQEDDGSEDWQVNSLLVDKAMRAARDMFKVEWVFADPSYWQNAVGQWALDFKELDREGRDIVFEFNPQRPKQMSEALERFHTAVMLGEDICHDGNQLIAQHIGNAVTYEVPQGTMIRKESKNSKKKIDAAIAATLAYEARGEAIADGRMRIKRKARMRTY